MKIVMVGAVRYSNFGDILFAKLFYEKLLLEFPKARILLYETRFNTVSDFCRTELDYKEKFKMKDLKDADVLIYFSGGYFSNSFESVKDKVLWHIRYALPGLYFAKNNKKIVVLGVGGGDFSWKLSLHAAKEILNKSQYISVRNTETKEKFIKIGVNSDIYVNADTAQVINDKKTEYIEKSKNIFLHIIPNDRYFELMNKKVFPALKKYIEENSGYRLIIGYDSVVKEKYMKYIYDAIDFFGEENAEPYIYESIEGMLTVLGKSWAVITPKLHVGIVSASFDKAVVSFPINYEKTRRYYNNIGEPNRCKSIIDINEDEAYSIIAEYISKPILISQEVITAARKNLDECSREKLCGEN